MTKTPAFMRERYRLNKKLSKCQWAMTTPPIKFDYLLIICKKAREHNSSTGGLSGAHSRLQKVTFQAELEKNAVIYGRIKNPPSASNYNQRKY